MAKTTRPSRTARPGAVRGGRRKRRSATAVAAESVREGTAHQRVLHDEDEIPDQDEALRAGDPDVSGLDAAHVGEETPGGSTPTPDQSRVDEIGRALGVEELDDGELDTSTDVLAERDRRGLGRSEE